MKKLLIGLTGGIGSGKSTALNILKKMGFYTLSCDEICNDLYKTHKVKKVLKASFPNAVKGEKRLTLDKKELSKALISDKDYKLLTSITTPLILESALKKIKRLNGNVVLETPILFESKLENIFDKIIVILRDKIDRIDAVKSRSNLSEKDVLTRLNRQIDYDTFDFSPYIVVENNGDKTALEKSLQAAVNKNILDK